MINNSLLAHAYPRKCHTLGQWHGIVSQMTEDIGFILFARFFGQPAIYYKNRHLDVYTGVYVS